MSSLSGLGSFLDSFAAGRNRLEDERYRRDRLALDRDRLSLDRDRLTQNEQNLAIADRNAATAEGNMSLLTQQYVDERNKEGRDAQYRNVVDQAAAGDWLSLNDETNEISFDVERFENGLATGDAATMALAGAAAASIKSNVPGFNFSKIRQLSPPEKDADGNVVKEAVWTLAGDTPGGEAPMTEGASSNPRDGMVTFTTSELAAHTGLHMDRVIGSTGRWLAQAYPGAKPSEYQTQVAETLDGAEAMEGKQDPNDPNTSMSRALTASIAKDPQSVLLWHAEMHGADKILEDEPGPLQGPADATGAPVTDTASADINFPAIMEPGPLLEGPGVNPRTRAIWGSEAKKLRREITATDTELADLAARDGELRTELAAATEGSQKHRAIRAQLRRVVGNKKELMSEREESISDFYGSIGTMLDKEIDSLEGALQGDPDLDAPFEERLTVLKAEQEKLEGFRNPVPPDSPAILSLKDKEEQLQEALDEGFSPEKTEELIDKGFLIRGEDTAEKVAKAMTDSGIKDFKDVRRLPPASQKLAFYLLIANSKPGSDEREFLMGNLANLVETGSTSMSAKDLIGARQKQEELGFKSEQLKILAQQAKTGLLNARTRANELRRAVAKDKSGVDSKTLNTEITKLSDFVSPKGGEAPTAADAERFIQSTINTWGNQVLRLPEGDPNKTHYINMMNAGASAALAILAEAEGGWNDDTAAPSTDDYELARSKVIMTPDGKFVQGFQALDANGKEVGGEISARRLKNLSETMYRLVFAANTPGWGKDQKVPEPAEE